MNGTASLTTRKGRKGQGMGWENRASKRYLTFVGIVEVKRVQTNDRNLVGNHFDAIIGTSLKDLV